MIAYARLLYTKGIDVNKEIATARWFQEKTSGINRRFTLEAIEVWDKGASGSFEEFVKLFVARKWMELCIGN